MTSLLKEKNPSLDMDNRDLSAFCAFFRSMPEKPQNTCRLFERSQGDFYSVHAEDAIEIAQSVFKTSSVIKYLGGDATTGIPSCTLSRLTAEAFLRDALLKHQMRIEIWGSENKKQWKIVQQASPGNLQDVEDLLFTNTEVTSAPVVLAVKLATSADQKIVGIAFADATQRELGVSEFIDNELYSNFESLIIQLGVKECVLPANGGGTDYDLNKIKVVIEKCGVVITETKKANFNTKDIEQDLKRLLGDELSITALPEYELKHAMASAACLIRYLGVLDDATNYGEYSLRQHDLSQFMRLDASALGALNLMPTSRDAGNKSMSLFGLLDRCKTSQGTRLLGQWLKQPLLSVPEIECRQTMVEAFVEDAELRQSLQESHLKSLPDMHRLAKKFQRGKANLQDVVRVYQVVVRLPSMIATLESLNAGENHMELFQENFISKLKEYSASLAALQEMVETTIDLDMIDRHEYMIKADFDAGLEQLRNQMNEYTDEMTKEHERVGKKLNMELDKKLKFEKSVQFGYCFRLTQKDAGIIRQQPREYTELQVIKAGTYFTTSKLRDLSTSFEDSSREYEKQQSALVKEVVNIASTYCPVFETLNGLIAKLDVLVSFAHISVHSPTPYVKPKVLPKGTGDLILKEARHPCLEVQEDVSFIPNDVELIRDKSVFQIITGPNMGGKSTYIRQIGVIALMAQCGCYVPCTEATICVFDCILARVGAGDMQLKGVSTFMAEMLETAAILRTATKDSLVVIDELGRGTSTYDGFGLAWAISEFFAREIGGFCLFATHFHELTTLAERVPTVRNLHVVAHVGDRLAKDITLLYKVKEGVCDQSFGIHVAELANFPETVVKLAKRKAIELEDFSKENEEPNSAAVTKCSREEVDQGTQMIESFLKEISNLPDLDSSSPETVVERVRKVKDERWIVLEGNEYVKELLATV